MQAPVADALRLLEAQGLAHRMGDRGVSRVVVTRSDGTLIGLFLAADLNP